MKELSLQTQTVLKKVRALRKLPETSGTVAAERRAINSLNVTDTLAVALALDADEAGL